jgi:kynurenine formamidase
LNYNWKVWFMWFHKKHLDKFFIQTSISVLKKTLCWKLTFIWKMTIIMLEAFVLKLILYVYQNTRWNQRKTTPKIYQMLGGHLVGAWSKLLALILISKNIIGIGFDFQNWHHNFFFWNSRLILANYWVLTHLSIIY